MMDACIRNGVTSSEPVLPGGPERPTPRTRAIPSTAIGLLPHSRFRTGYSTPAASAAHSPSADSANDAIWVDARWHVEWCWDRGEWGKWMDAGQADRKEGSCSGSGAAQEGACVPRYRISQLHGNCREYPVEEGTLAKAVR